MNDKQMGGKVGGYTPGPWAASGLYGAPEGNFLVWTQAEDHAVAHIFPVTHGGKDAESERLANTRLIAAAPELVDALIPLAAWAENERRKHSASGEENEAIYMGDLANKARAALAKARGI